MLRDRLVCGIANEAVQRRLLAEPKLTYEKAVELALSMETAARNVTELKPKRSLEGNGNGLLRRRRSCRATAAGMRDIPNGQAKFVI